MSLSVGFERISACYETVCAALLAERNDAGHWTGELSTSSLSTATAVMALEMVRRDHARADHRPGNFSDDASGPPADKLSCLIARGVDWLAAHQNEDGGWGDTTKSVSNISTTMLALGTLEATGAAERYCRCAQAAVEYVERNGGIDAVVRRYGRDRTFSAPILTQCALAGRVSWDAVPALPFELGCVPARFYKTVRLPVVSYALPALIAIGEVRHHFSPPRSRLLRFLRGRAASPALAVLDRIQPVNGGFLEATPLTSFVTMSLAGMGLSAHRVARRGLSFLVDSVRPDGSWPIDTNLATWNTTLAVAALGDDFPVEDRGRIREWLLGQQYRQVHPYTNAAPGGWAWTDLPGGVPDADDTPGCLLALIGLRGGQPAERFTESERESLQAGVRWLLSLQNRDGGWPTFCRGWGTLPFDRSAADITAHVLRALIAWQQLPPAVRGNRRLARRIGQALSTGFRFLDRRQRDDGSWLPLWFGNQFVPGDENPTYGTSRVLAAYRTAGLIETAAGQRGLDWLVAAQNTDGGWGGAEGVTSSVEETALAAHTLLSARCDDPAADRAVRWLVDCVETGGFRETAPIGFYFAKLWYFEKLYPLTFMVSALRLARHAARRSPREAGIPLRDIH